MESTNTAAAAGDEEEEEIEEEEVEVIDVDNDASSGALPVNVVEGHVNATQAAERGAVNDGLFVPNDLSTGGTEGDSEVEVEVEKFFYDADGGKAYLCFKELMRCDDLREVQYSTLQLVQLLELGKLEKGAVSTESKYNSRNGRWFNLKQKKNDSSSEGVEGPSNGESDLYIERDSLIQLNCKRGRNVCVENYRVLAFFNKFYNKWYLPTEDKFVWTNNKSRVENIHVLARLVKKVGSSYEEVQLEADGDWGPQQVYCIRHFKDILKVENQLDDL